MRHNRVVNKEIDSYLCSIFILTENISAKKKQKQKIKYLDADGENLVLISVSD